MKISDFPLWDAPTPDMEIPVIKDEKNGRIKLAPLLGGADAIPADLNDRLETMTRQIEKLTTRLTDLERLIADNLISMDVTYTDDTTETFRLVTLPESYLTPEEEAE